MPGTSCLPNRSTKSIRLPFRATRRRLCCFLLEDGPSLHGAEAILHDGKPVGVTTSAGWGHTVQKWIAYGYLPAGLAKADAFEIEAFCERRPARRIDGAPYDPGPLKILG